jgi:hypothetical protein
MICSSMLKTSGWAADLLGQLAALLVADVAGGRADQAGGVVLLHVVAHVERDQRVLLAEQELRQLLGQPGLADAAGAEEQEAAGRAVRVLQAGARAAHRLGDRGHRGLLVDHHRAEGVLHVEQALGLLLLEVGDRHAGHLRHRLGDDLQVDHRLGARLGLGLAPGGQHLLALAAQLEGLVAALGRLLEVLVADGLLLELVHLGDLLVELADVRRGRHRLQAQARAGLVDHVDRLVGQEAAVDELDRQVDRGLEGLVGVAHLVVVLVALGQAVEDGDRVVAVRRLDHHRLEAALEGAVLLDELAVLVEGGRADALDLAARQGGLEDVGGVDRALGAAGADQRVQLVDEQDHVLRPAHLGHHRLDALLELAAVLRAGDHHRQVEDHDALVVQHLGGLAVDDALGQALDDGGLADAGLAEQHRVVLGAARQDLDDALDLVGAADHRVELAVARAFGQVAAEGVEGGRLRLAGLRRGASRLGGGVVLGLVLLGDRAAEDLDDLLADLLELDAEGHEDVGGDALLLAQQGEQQVLGADVVVAELGGLLEGQLDDLLRARREGDLHGGLVGRPSLDDLLDLAADAVEVDVHGLEHTRGDAVTLLDQAEQDVLRADVLVVEALGFAAGEAHDLACAFSESVEHLRVSPGQVS